MRTNKKIFLLLLTTCIFTACIPSLTGTADTATLTTTSVGNKFTTTFNPGTRAAEQIALTITGVDAPAKIVTSPALATCKTINTSIACEISNQAANTPLNIVGTGPSNVIAYVSFYRPKSALLIGPIRGTQK